VGRCGRELCCSTWLRELKPVSLQLAKDQRLSLNPAQISGCCGRLMCCLTYEHSAYVEARKRFPREGKWLTTARARARHRRGHLAGAGDAEGRGRATAGRVELAELKSEVERVAASGARAGRGGMKERDRDGERGTDGRVNPKPYRYITTAIDYANGAPHMGHALEKIGGDVMARYRRRRARTCTTWWGWTSTGRRSCRARTSAGSAPRSGWTSWPPASSTPWERLHLSHDDFIRTTQDRHRRSAQEMVRRIRDADDLYTDTYAGYYCVGCEAYKTEDELEPASGLRRRGGDGDRGRARPRAAALRCPLHPGRGLEWMEEENWFFRLSKYQERLLDLLDERPEFVQPESRRNEIRRVIEGGLEDISVSRSRLPWGVPWPGRPDHVIYVWLEALCNYLSATGFPDQGYEDYWPADYHVIGKDITRFHCIYWPAFLMSAGLATPPHRLGPRLHQLRRREDVEVRRRDRHLDDAIDRHGPDALRYYLMRDIPWNGDGDFAWDRFDDVYTAELANDLGNLASRSLSMIERYRDGRSPGGERPRWTSASRTPWSATAPPWTPTSSTRGSPPPWS
jgi:methionyl-tRNA synthetase